VIPAAFASASPNASLDEIVKAIHRRVRSGRQRRGRAPLLGQNRDVVLLRSRRGRRLVAQDATDRLAHAFAIAGMTAPNLLFAGSGPPYPDPEAMTSKRDPWSTVTGIVAVLQPRPA